MKRDVLEKLNKLLKANRIPKVQFIYLGGYIGKSVAEDIEYAKSLNKEI